MGESPKFWLSHFCHSANVIPSHVDGVFAPYTLRHGDLGSLAWIALWLQIEDMEDGDDNQNENHGQSDAGLEIIDIAIAPG